MILAFTTKIKNEPTYFVEKIQKALKQNYNLPFTPDHVTKDFNFYIFNRCEPKIHTIREDKTERWKAGTKIDFFINVRQPNMFRFAPVLPVVSTQNIQIKYWDLTPKIYIDYINYPLDESCVIELAKNDGFDTVKDFFEYFNNDFKGKIIHWTDKRY